MKIQSIHHGSTLLNIINYIKIRRKGRDVGAYLRAAWFKDLSWQFSSKCTEVRVLVEATNWDLLGLRGSWFRIKQKSGSWFDFFPAGWWVKSLRNGLSWSFKTGEAKKLTKTFYYKNIFNICNTLYITRIRQHWNICEDIFVNHWPPAELRVQTKTEFEICWW